jgi:hypothetical protein
MSSFSRGRVPARVMVRKAWASIAAVAGALTVSPSCRPPRWSCLSPTRWSACAAGAPSNSAIVAVSAAIVELLTTFGASLEQAVELGELLPRLADTVHRGLAASWVTVSLPDTKVHAGRPDGPPALSVALERGPHLVGRIECDHKDGGYEPSRRVLYVRGAR